MVGCTRALVVNPVLQLLDEPASGLDRTEVVRLGALLTSVRDELGCSVALVEHDARFVMDHCDRIVVLAEGTILATGNASQIQGDPRVRQAYLGREREP